MNALGLAVALDEHADVSEALAVWEARERPLTEHTQDTAERLGDMNYWPDDVRSQVLRITGKCAPLGAERIRPLCIFQQALPETPDDGDFYELDENWQQCFFLG